MPIPTRGESMETYSEQAQRAKIKKGFTGDGRFTKPVTLPELNFVAGWPAKTADQLAAKGK